MALAAQELESRDELEMLSRRLVGETEEGLPRYFRTIGRIPLLTFEDEVRLATAIEAGRAASEALRSPGLSRLETVGRLKDAVARAEEARSRLIEANLRLVVSIARRYVNRGLPIDDLIQAGNLGLLRAVEKFDYRLGFRFSTYATWWVRQAVTRSVADQARTIRVPAHLLEAAQRVSRHASQLQVEEGREPTIEELSPLVGLSADRIREINRALPAPASLDIALGDDQDAVLGDFVPDPEDIELDDLADRDYLALELRGMLEALSDRERVVIGMRYGLDGESERTLEDIGRSLGVTRERARQIEAAALRKLRQPACTERLREFV